MQNVLYPIEFSEKREHSNYFDAKSINSIIGTLKLFLNSPEEREIKSMKNIEAIKDYSWKKTSEKTFEYIIKISNA